MPESKYAEHESWRGEPKARGRLRLGVEAIPVIAFLLIFAVTWPMMNKDRAGGHAKQHIYVVKCVKFQQPVRRVPIPRPKRRMVPIPDPTPSEPMPLNGDRAVPDELASGPSEESAQMKGLSASDQVLAALYSNTDSARQELRTDLQATVNRNRRTPRVFNGPVPEAVPGEYEPVQFVVGGSLSEPQRIKAPSPLYPEIARRAHLAGLVILECLIDKRGWVAEVKVLRGLPLGLTESAVSAVRQWRFVPATLNGRPVDVLYTLTIRFQLDGSNAIAPAGQVVPVERVEVAEVTGFARSFLDERAELDGLEFQEPRGYWSNTYVPGDRELRSLGMRLASWDRAGLAGHGARAPGLHTRAGVAQQPYDEPTTSAITVFTHADRRGLSGRERLLMEVGLRGTSRRSGRSPTMNIGIVLDLRHTMPLETVHALRSVVAAFVRNRDMGDRFTLVVAGPGGGLLVQPEQFRSNSVMGVLEGRIEEPEERLGNLGLFDAIELAAERVWAADDPTGPLGSSSLVLVTADRIDSVGPLTDQAHDNAVAGLPTSVIAVGERVDLDELDRLALNGQGHRLTVHDPGDALSLVETLLAGVSRTVARAVRLTIRLAPGIQLIDVVGSRRLDEGGAARVRAAEQAADLRLARNLGITSDRGLDDDGIQIVIPAFYAGDDHVILLDLVAPGPGPIADVTVRYKDLVHLRNGTTRAHLNLGSGRDEGPLERNVFKNLVTHLLGEMLGEASVDLRQGDLETVRQQLTRLHSLLAQLPHEVPGLGGDRDFESRLALIDEYLDVIGKAADPAVRDLIADSMRYAGHLVRLPALGSATADLVPR